MSTVISGEKTLHLPGAAAQVACSAATCLITFCENSSQTGGESRADILALVVALHAKTGKQHAAPQPASQQARTPPLIRVSHVCPSIGVENGRARRRSFMVPLDQAPACARAFPPLATDGRDGSLQENARRGRHEAGVKR